jgi:hypothetical protein
VFVWPLSLLLVMNNQLDRFVIMYVASMWV